MNKRPSDEEILDILATDERFSSDYLTLKKILEAIFKLTEVNESTVVQLKKIKGASADWNIENAHAEFNILNTEYNYFKLKQDDKDTKWLDLFTELAIACRTMIVLFEKNNTQNDKLAYGYAYKLMALYADPDSKEEQKKLFSDISAAAKDLRLDPILLKK